MTFEQFDVVVVPFPFTDSSTSKRRPALVLSDASALGDVIEHSVMAMITSARNSPWPLDAEIMDLDAAGLSYPSVVRMKLFTLDHRLVLRRAGKLAAGDAASVGDSLDTLLSKKDRDAR